MAIINRRFIDKHWLVFILRGILAVGTGCYALFANITDIQSTVAVISVLLLLMGIIDAVGALYSSTKKHGWLNAIIDAGIDVTAALMLLNTVNDSLAGCLLVLSIYTIASGLVDVFHGFLSTVDPTDRFIRILAGICGCVIGIVILNSGEFEISTFIRFYGAYALIVGITSMIYGAHNRAQIVEDKIARSMARKKTTRKTSSRKTTNRKKR